MGEMIGFMFSNEEIMNSAMSGGDLSDKGQKDLKKFLLGCASFVTVIVEGASRSYEDGGDCFDELSKKERRALVELVVSQIDFNEMTQGGEEEEE